MAVADRQPRESKSDRLAREAHLNVLLLAKRFGDDMERICRAHGVSHAQYVALWVLCLAEDADDGIPVGAIADGLLTRAADLTRLVDRLAKAGLAERLVNPADRRGVLVRATPLGSATFQDATEDVKRYHRSQWRMLSPAEFAEFSRLLGTALWSADADR